MNIDIFNYTEQNRLPITFFRLAVRQVPNSADAIRDVNDLYNQVGCTRKELNINMNCVHLW